MHNLPPPSSPSSPPASRCCSLNLSRVSLALNVHPQCFSANSEADIEREVLTIAGVIVQAMCCKYLQQSEGKELYSVLKQED